MVWDLDGFDYPTEVMLLPYSECGTALERVVHPPRADDIARNTQ